MVPPASHRVSRVPWYSRTDPLSHHAFAYRALTVFGHAFQHCSACLMVAHSATPRPGPSDRPYNPTHTPAGRPSGVVWFGLLPVRSPLLGEYSLFLAVLRCFSSGGALLRAYRFSTGYHPLPGDGLPHSEIIGSMRGSRSPMLFAAAHVLLRHLTPRHPPHAPSSFFFSHPHRVQPLEHAWPLGPHPTTTLVASSAPNSSTGVRIVRRIIGRCTTSYARDALSYSTPHAPGGTPTMDSSCCLFSC